MTASTTRRDLLRCQLAWAGMAALGPTLAAAESLQRPPSQRLLDAVATGEVDTVRALLGTDPGLLYTRDAEGRTAFALALLSRQPEVAELLRARGYRPDLHEAAFALDWERVETLTERAPGIVNQDHPIGGSAMYAAALGGAGNQIFHVYSVGGLPDANPRGGDGVTALRAAFDHTDLATAELTAASLLGNGADPNAPQRGDDTPLHAAARRGSRELVEMLVRKGAHVEARNEARATALELADDAGHRAVAELLRRHREVPRDHSTSRFAYDVDGEPYRPVDLSHVSVLVRNRTVGAAHFDLDEVRKVVGQHPELARAVATTTEAAVEGCAHTGRRPIVDYLLEHGAPCSLLTAVMRGDVRRAKALLDEDSLRIHERGPHDFALLWYPVLGGGLLELAELLLARGAEIERQHFLGTTALHYAAVGDQVEMAQLLLEHGADPERKGRKFDPAGQTPLEIAEARGSDEVAKLLRGRTAKS